MSARNNEGPDRPQDPELHLYRELAGWFHLFTAPEEYADEAAQYARLIREASAGAARTLLELGSGGGNNASHLKHHFALTLVDRSEQMLAVSETLNPECEHLPGDMRTVRLDRCFDAVFVHDAVTYVTSEHDLRLVVATAAAHLSAGGVALFVPDYVRERFAVGTSHGGHDGEGRSARYLEWTWDPDPGDTTYFSDMVYVFRDGDALPRIEYDRHVCGLFPRDTWTGTLEGAGFAVAGHVADYGDEDGRGDLFVGVKR